MNSRRSRSAPRPGAESGAPVRAWYYHRRPGAFACAGLAGHAGVPLDRGESFDELPPRMTGSAFRSSRCSRLSLSRISIDEHGTNWRHRRESRTKARHCWRPDHAASGAGQESGPMSWRTWRKGQRWPRSGRFTARSSTPGRLARPIPRGPRASDGSLCPVRCSAWRFSGIDSLYCFSRNGRGPASHPHSPHPIEREDSDSPRRSSGELS